MKSRFNYALSVELRPFTAVVVAKRAKTTTRTAENWKEGMNGPGWRSIVAMLNDPVLRPVVLAAAERANQLSVAPALRPRRETAAQAGGL